MLDGQRRKIKERLLRKHAYQTCDIPVVDVLRIINQLENLTQRNKKTLFLSLKDGTILELPDGYFPSKMDDWVQISDLLSNL